MTLENPEEQQTVGESQLRLEDEKSTNCETNNTKNLQHEEDEIMIDTEKSTPAPSQTQNKGYTVIRRLVPRKNRVEKCLLNDDELSIIGGNQNTPSFLYSSISQPKDINQQLIRANQTALHQMDNMNAENFTEREIHVYDPVDKAVDGEMDYL